MKKKIGQEEKTGQVDTKCLFLKSLALWLNPDTATGLQTFSRHFDFECAVSLQPQALRVPLEACDWKIRDGWWLRRVDGH